MWDSRRVSDGRAQWAGPERWPTAPGTGWRRWTEPPRPPTAPPPRGGSHPRSGADRVQGRDLDTEPARVWDRDTHSMSNTHHCNDQWHNMTPVTHHCWIRFLKLICIYYYFKLSRLCILNQYIYILNVHFWNVNYFSWLNNFIITYIILFSQMNAHFINVYFRRWFCFFTQTHIHFRNECYFS